MKSKYDVMNLHMKIVFHDLLLFYKILNEARIFVDDMSFLYVGFFEPFKKLAHLGYENYLDIERINDATVKRKFLFSLVGYDEFQKSYANVTNRYLKTMITFMVLESEGFKKNYAASVYGERILTNKENEFIEYLSTREDFSEKNKSLLNVIKSDNFDVSKLSQEQRERINKYHSDYMNSSIFTDSYIDDKEGKVIQHAKAHARATFKRVLIKKIK